MASNKGGSGKEHDTGGHDGGGGSGHDDASYGVNMDKYDVRAHHDGYKPSAIGAKAYAQGGDVHFKGGGSPSHGMVGHEAAHAVQQTGGGRVKPTNARS